MKLDELWAVVNTIPKGKVASYGACGRALPNPASGRMVGRWMTQAPEGVPWWRVVAKSGLCPIGKMDPALGIEQRSILVREGVVFDGDRVQHEFFWEP